MQCDIPTPAPCSSFPQSPRVRKFIWYPISMYVLSRRGKSSSKDAFTADGTPFPGGFLTSARQADPSGAAAAQAVRSAALEEAAIEAFGAGAPDAGGGKSSSKDAFIFKLGRSAVAKAGTSGWPAYQQGALEARQKGGHTASIKAVKTASIKAVKAGAPDAGGGQSSRADVTIFRMSGGDKSSANTWTARQDLARTVTLAGSKKGGANKATAARIAAMELPIATHSHECMEPQCRRPVKCLSKFVKGKMNTTFSHHCPAKDGKQVDGFGKHMCSTCHQTGRVCNDAICRYSKCTTSTSACAHLHDGSGVPRK